MHSNLNYYKNVRRIPLNPIWLNIGKDLLLSTLRGRELFRATVDGESWTSFLPIASFYDYLEIQPVIIMSLCLETVRFHHI